MEVEINVVRMFRDPQAQDGPKAQDVRNCWVTVVDGLFELTLRRF